MSPLASVLAWGGPTLAGSLRASLRLAGVVLRVLRGFTPEGRVVFLASFVVGAMGLDVDKTQVYLLWSVMAGLVAASLASRWFPSLSGVSLSGVSLSVVAPSRATAGEPAELAVEVVNRSARALEGVVLEGPRLAADGRWTSAKPRVASLAPGASARASSSVVFARRGERQLGPFTARARTPLGLAFGPAVSSEERRVIVVPRIAPVMTLEVPEGSRYQPGGVALASKTGESMELLGVRPYRPGDPVRDLHARSWARTGKPAVREYLQEYFSRIGVVVDTDLSRSTPARLEAAISLAAGVVACVSRGEALIDLLVIGDRAYPLTLGRSLGFLEQALDLLAVVEPGPPSPAAALVTALRPYLARLSALVVVAQQWDGERAAVADEVRRHGVALRVLVVAGEGAPAGEATPVPEPDIARGTPLYL